MNNSPEFWLSEELADYHQCIHLKAPLIFLEFLPQFFQPFQNQNDLFSPTMLHLLPLSGLIGHFLETSSQKKFVNCVHSMSSVDGCPRNPDLIQHIVGPVKSFKIDLGILVQNFFFVCFL